VSDTVIFAIGAVVFAITVVGVFLAGGLAMTREEIAGSSELRQGAEAREGLEAGARVPLIVRY